MENKTKNWLIVISAIIMVIVITLLLNLYVTHYKSITNRNECNSNFNQSSCVTSGNYSMCNQDGGNLSIVCYPIMENILIEELIPLKKDCKCFLNTSNGVLLNIDENSYYK